jgi:DNA polymerase-3 subunit delta
MCCIFSCDPPKQHALGQFVQQQAKQLGCTISHTDAMLLTDTLGYHLGQLAHAVEQLALYASPHTHITTQHIEECLNTVRENHIFELTDAVGQNDIPLAIKTLNNMMHHGENSLGVVAMLTRHVRQLLQVHEAQRTHGSANTLAKHIGVPPFVAEQLLKQVKKFSSAQLFTLLQKLHQADITLKSSTLPAHLVLSEVFLTSIHPSTIPVQ